MASTNIISNIAPGCQILVNQLFSNVWDVYHYPDVWSAITSTFTSEAFLRASPVVVIFKEDQTHMQETCRMLFQSTLQSCWGSTTPVPCPDLECDGVLSMFKVRNGYGSDDLARARFKCTQCKSKTSPILRPPYITRLKGDIYWQPFPPPILLTHYIHERWRQSVPDNLE